MKSVFLRLAPLALAAVLLAPSSAWATASAKQIKTSVAEGVEYLRSEQQSDGSFAGFGGEWALSALAAAKVAPADVTSGPGGTDARTWYQGLVGEPESWPGYSEAPVTEYEDAALAAYAAGIDPARVSVRQNLLARVVARYDTAAPGYYGSPGAFSGTVFALLALEDTNTTSKQRIPRALLDESVEVLRRNQHTDGGWTYQRAEGNEAIRDAAGEPDETGAAIAALCGAGVSTEDPAIAHALEYLRADLGASGDFESPYGPNTDSTAWAVEGLDACGIGAQDAQFTIASGKTPIDFLISQQRSGGGFAYEPEETEANLYSSQDAVRAIAGGGFTAKPVKPASGPTVLAADAFSSNADVTSELTLVVDTGSALHPCAVSIAPGAPTTTLQGVLAAAESGSSPAGCVSSYVLGAKSAVTQIDGAPATPGPGWTVSIDGGKEAAAKGKTVVKVGDTLYLKLG
jgi:hypothetical protein